MPMGIKQLVDSSSSWKTPLGPTHIPLGELEWMSYSGCQEQKGLDEKQTLVSYAQWEELLIRVSRILCLETEVEQSQLLQEKSK